MKRHNDRQFSGLTRLFKHQRNSVTITFWQHTYIQKIFLQSKGTEKPREKAKYNKGKIVVCLP